MIRNLGRTILKYVITLLFTLKAYWAGDMRIISSLCKVGRYVIVIRRVGLLSILNHSETVFFQLFESLLKDLSL